jgi:ferredoxin, 2Fe-2S
VINKKEDAMPHVIFIDSTGEARTVEAALGATLMETAMQNGIPEIDAECGGACACATCHVYVADAWLEKTGKPERMEEDMLDFAFEIRPTSRLSCQIRIRENLAGLVVHTPSRQS